MSMLSAEGHHVSLHQLPDCNEVAETIDGCGAKRSEWFASFDPGSSSWKTRQACFDWFANSEASLAAWPEAGECVNGECFRLPEWERIIKEKGCSFFPTPTAGTPPKNGLRWDDNGGSYARIMLRKFMSLEEIKQNRNPEYLEWQMGFPIKFTDVEHLETVVTQDLRSGSADDFKN